jgi:hypothetical protein
MRATPFVASRPRNLTRIDRSRAAGPINRSFSAAGFVGATASPSGLVSALSWRRGNAGRRALLTVRPLPSNIAERGSTERNSHPKSLSPFVTPVAVLRVFIRAVSGRVESVGVPNALKM